jgi:hypothetical protein
VCLVMSWVIAPGAHGQSAVVLHEYIAPDPAEDLALGTLSPSGKMPAAIRTPSGLVSAPDPYREPQSSKEPTYGPAASRSPRFQIDGVTSDPGTLHYHEPFRPSIAPFKRLRAFDAVNEAFELVVRDANAHSVALDNSPEAGEDEFFGDITVNGGRNVPVPSVAAGMRVLAADLEPAIPFQLALDSAENWYLVAPGLSGKARLVMRLAASRSALSPVVTVSSYSQLASALPAVPAVVARAAVPVLEQIGISRVSSPTDAVRAMVAYFRGFTPSTDYLKFAAGRELYQNLALLKRGVCRHRAYAFVVTSLALGIPARMVHNEAHAWVEVFDGRSWHRIDLGGAAPSFHFDGEVPSGRPYRMPPDGYEWPAQAAPATQSRVDAAEQSAMTEVPADEAPGSPSAQRAAPAKRESDVPQRPPADAMDAREPGLAESAQPGVVLTPLGDANVTFSLKSSSTLHRGEPLVLEGEVKQSVRGCPARVDFALRNGALVRALGSTLADERGHFSIQTNVPSDMRIGRYDVVATRSDPAACTGP